MNISPRKINAKNAKEAAANGSNHLEKAIPAVIAKEHLPFSSFKKVLSFIGTSFSFFAFLLFLSLPLFFLMVKGFVTSNLIHEDNHKKDSTVHLKAVPADIEPAKALVGQIIVPADAQQTDQNVPALSKK